MVWLAGDDVEVVHHRNPPQVEQVLALAEVAGAVALPAADMGQGVLDLDALAEPGPPRAGVLAGPQLHQQPLIGWICTLRPRGLVVHRRCSGQAWHAAAGNWTLPPGVNGIVTLLGQVRVEASKSMVKEGLAKRPPGLRTGNALQ